MKDASCERCCEHVAYVCVRRRALASASASCVWRRACSCTFATRVRAWVRALACKAAHTTAGTTYRYQTALRAAGLRRAAAHAHLSSHHHTSYRTTTDHTSTSPAPAGAARAAAGTTVASSCSTGRRASRRSATAHTCGSRRERGVRVCHRSVTSECDVRVCHRSVPSECDVRVWRQCAIIV